MPLRAMFEEYIAEFNAGNASGYSRFYAPDVAFRNGAGDSLRGAQAIVDYYTGLKADVARSIAVQGLLTGERSIAAALASQFTALSDHVVIGPTTLRSGDRLSIESIALYEIEDGRFARIEATTLRRAVLRKDEI
ncbi:nuclear transport factor 2 family protein [Sphingomonas canadensis]|uniref:Nuclear transport factor 2 family protein n=1 Tax=Sphingomonas canadensis TaxID=1219257 RepID=A0ABW3H9U5_9SPHN|nr:nuclear transport factor 2 family protein [Sphingomonas canadensis]MCW3837639.1 nuclear transport factor 2 family protein [Sphingomonas canadensis]